MIRHETLAIGSKVPRKTNRLFARYTSRSFCNRLRELRFFINGAYVVRVSQKRPFASRKSSSELPRTLIEAVGAEFAFIASGNCAHTHRHTEKLFVRYLETFYIYIYNRTFALKWPQRIEIDERFRKVETASACRERRYSYYVSPTKKLFLIVAAITSEKALCAAFMEPSCFSIRRQKTDNRGSQICFNKIRFLSFSKGNVIYSKHVCVKFDRRIDYARLLLNKSQTTKKNVLV